MSNPALLNDEDFIADCLSSREVHPVLRRFHWPEEETAKCRACGDRFRLCDLTDDLLCRECDKVVKELERGIIR